MQLISATQHSPALRDTNEPSAFGARTSRQRQAKPDVRLGLGVFSEIVLNDGSFPVPVISSSRTTSGAYGAGRRRLRAWINQPKKVHNGDE